MATPCAGLAFQVPASLAGTGPLGSGGPAGALGLGWGSRLDRSRGEVRRLDRDGLAGWTAMACAGWAGGARASTIWAESVSLGWRATTCLNWAAAASLFPWVR